MLDWLGPVAYAVMGFGGFLGPRRRPLSDPVAAADLQRETGGYEVNLTDDQLKNAPHYATGEEWKWIARRASASTTITACRRTGR